MKTIAISFILGFAFLGLTVSAYLAGNEGKPVICSFQAFDCSAVLQSPYSKVMGVPLSYVGVMFYGLLFAISAFELMYRQRYLRRAVQALAAIGLIASAYFIFLQTSVINALCIYCVISAMLTLLIFIAAYFVEPLSPQRAIEMSPPRRRTDLVLPPPI